MNRFGELSPRRISCRAVLAAIFAALALASLASASDDVATGDAHWERRGDGAVGAVAKPAEIDQAVAAYRRALVATPDSADIRAKLLRALFFRGVYCGAADEEKKKLFGEAKSIGDDGVARIEKSLAGKKGAERVAALRAVPGSAALYLWTAADWGEWALAYGKMAAAREGAAARIRDLSQTSIDIDPGFEEGGAYRVLGRLHHQSPSIPFITGWVSRGDAMANLRKAMTQGAKNKTNQYFLAEAILDYESKKKAEAMELLTRCANDPPRDELRIEELHYAEMAKKLLAGMKG